MTRSSDDDAARVRRVCVFPGLLRIGGTVRVMLNLAEALGERGVEVDIFLTHDPGVLAYMVPDGVTLTVGRRGNVASLPALIRYLRRRRPDALLAAHHAPNVVSVVARMIARVPTKVVVTVHNDSSSLPKSRGFRTRLLRQAMRLAYRRAHAVVSVSNGVAEDAARVLDLPRTQIRVIYNPTISRNAMARAADDVDETWFPSPGEIVVLGVGRLAPQKDFATLIRAFAVIRREIQARLVILGEGQDRPDLERLADELGLSEDVSMPGVVPSAIPFMKRASVLVLSSRWEGFPGVLIEALAVGTPVVATDCPSGPAEILENGRFGRLVPVGDAEALAAATLDTLRNRPPPNELIERGQAFSAERSVAAYLDLIETDQEATRAEPRG